MASISWTQQALDDLDRLELFLLDKSPRVAAQAVLAIMEATDVLMDFPQAGRMTPDLDPEHRELLVPFSNSGYVIGYGVYGDRVEILDVHHMREDD